MYQEPYHMTPFLPRDDVPMKELALEVIKVSERLYGGLHPITFRSMTDFLRIINSYYSNLIEGHDTHPVDIERAMRKQYDHDPEKRDLQIESEIHVELEALIDKRLEDKPEQIDFLEFIRWIHRCFYERLPARFSEIRNEKTGEIEPVIPGLFRTREVAVGKHIAPHYEALPAFMAVYFDTYDLSRFPGTGKLIAIAAGHHRLMWIHPFLDGNGRVARLLSGALIKLSGVSGYGLWSVSRGFGRQKERYLQHLARADAPRQGDLDGRGNLSQKALDEFCRFFLETCLDQARYMGSLLEIPGLLNRIRFYIDQRAEGAIPDKTPVRKEAYLLLKEALLMGEFARGRAPGLTGLKERTARNLLRHLTEEGLLVSDTPKGPVRIGIPAATLPFLFPALVPNV